MSLPLEMAVTRRLLLRQLADIPVFAGCNRARLAQVARWGDMVGAREGDVLAVEGSSAHWFFMVLSGAVDVVRNGETIATLRRGEHFGERDIIGFGPQSATLVATEATVCFALGRRYLLSLVVIDDLIRRHLFPEADAADYRSFERELRAQGYREWRRLGPPTPPVPLPSATRAPQQGGLITAQSHWRRGRGELIPGRAMSWREAVALLSGTELVTDGATPVAAPIALSAWPKRIFLATVGTVALFVLGMALLYHPPVAVVRAGPVIDVVGDIQITGLEVSPLNGRYLLVTANVERPNLARAALAWMRGERVVPAGSLDAQGVSRETAFQRGRTAFLDSQQVAIALAAHAVGVDAGTVEIDIRDRGFIGPSAGLVYALALEDLLDPTDLADGRAIAATGTLLSDGRVRPVGWVPFKAQAALRGGAELLLVPASQTVQADGAGPVVLGVTTLDEAVQLIRDTG